MRRLLLLTLLVLMGCESGSSGSELRFEMIRADGQNAARGLSGHLVVEVEQGGVPIDCPNGACATPIMGGDFDLVLPIRSLTDDTLVRAWLCNNTNDAAECTLDRADRVSALPRFAVFGEGFETGELPARLVMEPHDSCAVLQAESVSTSGDDVLLSVARRDAAVFVRRNAALIVGGVAGSEQPSGAVDFYDQVVAELRPPLPTLSPVLGRARGVMLSDDLSLVAGGRSFFYIRNPVPGPPVLGGVDLHDGAGLESAVVERPGGAAVLGGGGGATASWVATDGAVEISSLATARVNAAAGAMASGVLVVGGGVGAEIARASGSTALEVEERLLPDDAEGGFVAVSPDGDAALYFGFVTGGAVSTESVLFTGCSDCAAAEGPEWTRARAEASFVTTDAGTSWVIGGDASNLTDRVRWEGAVPRFEDGPELTHARAGASVIEQASGIIVVLGGEGPDRMRGDVELCYPSRLDPL
ncbi:MAG: hypothetical protein AB8I08_10935 [Sandaracinaceae bacterium]